MKHYLGVFATHPIQYHVPLWRKLAARDDVRIHVYYASDDSVRGAVDRDFGVPVAWDVPLLEGYPYTFLRNVSRKPSVAGGFWGVNCPEVRRIIARERFDAVLAHGYANYFAWQVFGAAWRRGVVSMIRGDTREGAGIGRQRYFEMARSAVLRQLYRRVTVGLAVGEYMRRHFAKHGMAPERIVDCPHCVDTDLFETARAELLPQREVIRAELGIPSDAVVLLFTGKLIPRKQPLLLAAGLEAMRHKDRVWLLVAGDGELREQAEAASRRALGDRVTFLGFVNQTQLPRCYVASDVFVMASLKETWGLVVNEAMTMGLPVVLSDRIGCREDLLLEGRTGLSFPHDDPRALAACLDQLVSDAELRKRMGQQAREHIGRYSSNAAVEGIVAGIRAGLAWRDGRRDCSERGSGARVSP